MNTDWPQHQFFAALDWASDHHDVVVVDRQGAVLAEFRFAHNAAGWGEFSEKMKRFVGAPFTLEPPAARPSTNCSNGAGRFTR